MAKQHTRLNQTGHAPDDARSETAADCRFPDVICIGAQKAGTTWLDRNLRLHPNIWLPPIKELNYFNELYITHSNRWTARQRRKKGIELFERYLKNTLPKDRSYMLLARIADIIAGNISDSWYGRIFALAKPQQLCCEIAPDYSLLPSEGISHVIRLMPHLKMLFLIRDPIERNWSHIRMVARANGISSLQDLVSLARNPDVVQRADYPRIISNWAQSIPDARRCVITIDDIDRAPMSVLERLCSFIGAKFNPDWFAGATVPVHVGDSLEMPPEIYELLKQQLRSTYTNILEQYPVIAKPWVAKHY